MCALDMTRTRKLPLKADEIKRLIGKVEQRGFTLVPLDLHYKTAKSNVKSHWRAVKRSTTNAT